MIETTYFDQTEDARFSVKILCHTKPVSSACAFCTLKIFSKKKIVVSEKIFGEDSMHALVLCLKYLKYKYRKLKRSHVLKETEVLDAICQGIRG